MEQQFADPDDIDDMASFSLVLTVTSTSDELDQYLKMNIEDIYKQSNPSLFWKDNQTKLPSLSLLARRLFSIPVTSAGVERSFSAAGLVLTERHCSLDPNTVNDVLFVRSIQASLDQKSDFLSSNHGVFLMYSHEILNKQTINPVDLS
jgi:hypothetical protein